MNSFDIDSEPKTTQFNADLSWQARISNILTSCNIASFNLDVDEWFRLLDILRVELITLIPSEENIKFKKELSCINELLHEHHFKKTRNEFLISHDLKDRLTELECSLRLIAAKGGLFDIKSKVQQ